MMSTLQGLSNLTFISKKPSKDDQMISIYLDAFEKPVVLTDKGEICEHNIPLNISAVCLRQYLCDSMIKVSTLSHIDGETSFKVIFLQRGRGGGCASSTVSKYNYPYQQFDRQSETDRIRTLKKGLRNKVSIIFQAPTSEEARALKLRIHTSKILIKKYLTTRYGMDHEVIKKYKKTISTIFLKDNITLKIIAKFIFNKLNHDFIQNASEAEILAQVRTIANEVEGTMMDQIIWQVKNYPKSLKWKSDNLDPPKELSLRDWIIPFSSQLSFNLISRGLLNRFNLSIGDKEAITFLITKVQEEERIAIQKIKDFAFQVNWKKKNIKSIDYIYKKLLRDYITYLESLKEPTNEKEIQTRKGKMRIQKQKVSRPPIKKCTRESLSVVELLNYPQLSMIEILSQDFRKFISTLEYEILQERNLLDHDVASLVTYYNRLVLQQESPWTNRQKKTIIDLLSSVLELCKNSDKLLTRQDLQELIPLQGIQDEYIYRNFFEFLLQDIRQHILFEPHKIEALGMFLVFAVKSLTSDEYTQSKQDNSKNLFFSADDMIKSLEILQQKMNSLTIEVDNQQLHAYLDVLSRVLFVMVLMRARGVKGAKKDEIIKLVSPMYINLAQKIWNNFKEIGKDPSLDIKVNYILECLARIQIPENEQWANGFEICLNLLDLGNNLVQGLFKLEPQKIIKGISILANLVSDAYLHSADKWFEISNYIRALISYDLQQFITAYFMISTSPEDQVPNISNKNVYFYIIDSLDKLIRDRNRALGTRTDALKLFWHIFYDKAWNSPTISLKRFRIDHDIKFLIRKRLANLCRMPSDDGSEAENFLASLANQTLVAICLTEKEHHQARQLIEEVKKTKFEFVGEIPKPEKNIYSRALRFSQSKEFILASMQSKCFVEYEEYLKPLHLIQIEGAVFKNNSQISQKQIVLETDGLIEFLNDSKSRVLLIQGDAGSGKSIFMKEIEKRQWGDYCKGVSDYIPIFVRLSEIKDPSRCIEETFKKFGCDSKTLETLSSSDLKYLFLFDGYDELKIPKNLWIVNNIHKWGKSKQNKLIITSRAEYLKAYGTNYERYFSPKGFGSNSDSRNEGLKEYRIADVSEEQRKLYILKTVKHNEEKFIALNSKIDEEEEKILSKWLTVSKYLKTIQEDIVGLEKLIRTPYMLKIIIDILPYLERQSIGVAGMTKAKIYKAFTKQRFEEEAERIQRNKSIDIPQQMDLVTSFYNYSKDLAVNMYLSGLTSIEAESPNYPDPQKFIVEKENQEKKDDGATFNRFFSADIKTRLGKLGTPIIEIDGKVRFAHKSILEYFAARVFYELIKFSANQTTKSFEKSLLNIKLLYADNKTDAESDVLNFLVDMIKDNEASEKLSEPEINDEHKVTVNATENLNSILSRLFPHQRDKQDIYNDGKYEVNQNDANNLKKVLEFPYVGNLLLLASKLERIMENIDTKSKIIIESNLSLGQQIRSIMVEELIKGIREEIDLQNSRIFDKENMVDEDGVETEVQEEPQPLTEKQKAQVEKMKITLENLKNSLKFYAKRTIGFKMNAEYDGDFLDEDGVKAQGQGRALYNETQDFYEGEFQDNQRHGKGKMIYSKGGTYNGDWEYDQRSGQGNMSWPGSFFKGTWVNDIKQGTGKYMDEKGIVYNGEWDNDLMEGTFKLKFNGSMIIFDLQNLEKEKHCLVAVNGSKNSEGGFAFKKETKSALTIENMKQKMVTKNYYVNIEFKTSNETGDLFTITDSSKLKGNDRILSYSKSNLQYQPGDAVKLVYPMTINVSDNNWHALRFETYDNEIRIKLDRKIVAKTENVPKNKGQLKTDIIALGHIENLSSFEGAIKSFKVGTFVGWNFEEFEEFECEFVSDVPEKIGKMTFKDGKIIEGSLVQGIFIPSSGAFESIMEKFIIPKGFFAGRLDIEQSEIFFTEYIRKKPQISLKIGENGKIDITQFYFIESDTPFIVAEPGEKIKGSLTYTAEGIDDTDYKAKFEAELRAKATDELQILQHEKKAKKKMKIIEKPIANQENITPEMIDEYVKRNMPPPRLKQVVAGFNWKNSADCCLFNTDTTFGDEVTLEFIAPDCEGIHELRLLKIATDSIQNAMSAWEIVKGLPDTGFGYVIVARKG